MFQILVVIVKMHKTGNIESTEATLLPKGQMHVGTKLSYPFKSEK